MIKVEIVDLHSIIPIRHEVLRQGKPIETCYFNEDTTLLNVHFGAFQVNTLVGIASIYQQGCPGLDCGDPTWQLRGMAVLPEFQGQSIGSALVQGILYYLKQQSEHFLLWCNARKTAVAFYKRLRFSVISGEFDIPSVGPHYRMSLQFS